jgi:hypothetical protein
VEEEEELGLKTWVALSAVCFSVTKYICGMVFLLPVFCSSWDSSDISCSSVWRFALQDVVFSTWRPGINTWILIYDLYLWYISHLEPIMLGGVVYNCQYKVIIKS